jgi:cell division transport system permease protein
MRAQVVLSEVGAGLRRNVTMTLASMVVVTMTLVLLGVALMVHYGTAQTKQDFFGQLDVQVFLDQPCGTANAPSSCLTPDERTSVQQTLQQLPQVKSVQYVSQARGYQIFKAENSDNEALVKSTPIDAIPESFVVKLKNPQQFDIVKSAVGEAPGVSTVADASHTLKTIFSFFGRITFVVWVFAGITLVATVLLIYNAMRVAAFTRRRETGIMRLVGASNLAIQAPFVLEGAVIGLTGMAFAVGLLIGFRELIHSVLTVPLVREFGRWSTLWHSLPIVIIIGILMPSIASYLTLQRHLRV